MVAIRILRGKIVAWGRSLLVSDLESVACALILLVAFAVPGEDHDESAGTSRSVAPVPVEPLGVPPVVPTASIDPLERVLENGSEAAAGERSGSHPEHLLQLPASAESALVFDLQDHRMHLFASARGSAVHRGDYFVAVGKNGIDKQREGDEKTPVGIYFISSYIPGASLPAIYGVGAFPINYPNAWDRRLGRTGSGIWIHGTDKDDESLLPESSRGCLTLRNADFETLFGQARIRTTPVIVSDSVSWTEPEELEADRAGLAAAIEAWRQDWESLDTDSYLRHYSPAFRTNSMSRRAWVAHKRRVNRSKSYIRIGVEDVGIYAYPGEPGLFLVTFEQHYRSDNFANRKWKQQYWRREEGEWRIVHEG